MKRGFLTAIILLAIFASATFAQEPIRLAVFDGGHPFDEPAFDALLAETAKSIPDRLTVERFHFPADRDKLGPELADSFDVILFYDMDNTPLSDEQKSRIEALFQKGIGVFALHHHVCSNQNWPDYWKYLGGIAVFESNKMIADQERELSTFIGGQQIGVKIEPNHSLFWGLKDFTIEDEAYGKCYVSPEATILATTDHELSTRAVAWQWKYGRSDVLTLLLGHDAKAYTNFGFRLMFRQGIETLAFETRREHRWSLMPKIDWNFTPDEAAEFALKAEMTAQQMYERLRDLRRNISQAKFASPVERKDYDKRLSRLEIRLYSQMLDVAADDFFLTERLLTPLSCSVENQFRSDSSFRPDAEALLARIDLLRERFKNDFTHVARIVYLRNSVARMLDNNAPLAGGELVEPLEKQLEATPFGPEYEKLFLGLEVFLRCMDQDQEQGSPSVRTDVYAVKRAALREKKFKLLCEHENEISYPMFFVEAGPEPPFDTKEKTAQAEEYLALLDRQLAAAQDPERLVCLCRAKLGFLSDSVRSDSTQTGRIDTFLRQIETLQADTASIRVSATGLFTELLTAKIASNGATDDELKRLFALLLDQLSFIDGGYDFYRTAGSLYAAHDRLYGALTEPQKGLFVTLLTDYDAAFRQRFDAWVASGGKPFEEPTAILDLVMKSYTQIGKPITLEGTTADGKEFHWSDYAGKVVLIDFWGTRCKPCIAEFPFLKEQYAKYRDKGFEIVGVCFGGDEANTTRMNEIIAKNALMWPTIDDAVRFNAGQPTNSSLWAGGGVPFAILVGRDGKIIATDQDARGENLAERLAKIFEK